MTPFNSPHVRSEVDTLLPENEPDKNGATASDNCKLYIQIEGMCPSKTFVFGTGRRGLVPHAVENEKN
jgi:hypothetical protein